MGIRVRYEQQSEAWRLWRQNGLGGSDAGTIMGVNRFKTLDVLIREKAQHIPPPHKPNIAMQMGTSLEPFIRQKYQALTHLFFESAEFEHEKYPFLKTSLDGLNEDNNLIIEIKTTQSLNAKHKILNAQIPEYYIPQIQHNLMVSGAHALHIVLCVVSPHGLADPNKANDMVYHKVLPDETYQKELLEKEIKAWEQIQWLKRKSLEHSESKVSGVP